MANELDEMTGPVNAEGRDVNVIEKQLPVKVGVGSQIFEIALWCVGIPVWLISGKPVTLLLGLVVGCIYLYMKVNAANYFRQLQQKIQQDASQIDNYLEQRVQILQNVAPLVNKAVDLDKDVMTAVAALRGGGTIGDVERNNLSAQIDGSFARLFPQIEAYPELKSHTTIMEAMRQNANLQKEITAARTLYNDTVALWNTSLYEWPAKMIVAARAGYTTRIPFTASAETKAQARGVFF